MKKLIVSLLAVVAFAGLSGAANDMRQLVSIPSGQTIVTNAVMAGMAIGSATTARLDSYALGASASITNLTIAVRIVGTTYTNDITAVAGAVVASTPAAITVKQVVSTLDYFVVTTVGLTNAVATQLYIDLQGY